MSYSKYYLVLDGPDFEEGFAYKDPGAYPNDKELVVVPEYLLLCRDEEIHKLKRQLELCKEQRNELVRTDINGMPKLSTVLRDALLNQYDLKLEDV